MHRIRNAFAAGVMALAFLTLSSIAAQAEERVCRGTIGAATVDNLRVPQNATCNLNRTRVKGTIKVESGTSDNSMKKKKTGRTRAAERDELRPEYDFATMKGGVRGKYAERYRAGTNLALLDPEIADAFPTDESVNEALRVILKAAAGVSRPGSPATKRRKAAKS